MYAVITYWDQISKLSEADNVNINRIFRYLTVFLWVFLYAVFVLWTRNLVLQRSVPVFLFLIGMFIRLPSTFEYVGVPFSGMNTKSFRFSNPLPSIFAASLLC